MYMCRWWLPCCVASQLGRSFLATRSQTWIVYLLKSVPASLILLSSSSLFPLQVSPPRFASVLLCVPDFVSTCQSPLITDFSNVSFALYFPLTLLPSHASFLFLSIPCSLSHSLAFLSPFSHSLALLSPFSHSPILSISPPFLPPLLVKMLETFLSLSWVWLILHTALSTYTLSYQWAWMSLSMNGTFLLSTCSFILTPIIVVDFDEVEMSHDRPGQATLGYVIIVLSAILKCESNPNNNFWP